MLDISRNSLTMLFEAAQETAKAATAKALQTVTDAIQEIVANKVCEAVKDGTEKALEAVKGSTEKALDAVTDKVREAVSKNVRETVHDCMVKALIAARHSEIYVRQTKNTNTEWDEFFGTNRQHETDT